MRNIRHLSLSVFLAMRRLIPIALAAALSPTEPCIKISPPESIFPKTTGPNYLAEVRRNMEKRKAELLAAGARACPPEKAKD